MDQDEYDLEHARWAMSPEDHPYGYGDPNKCEVDRYAEYSVAGLKRGIRVSRPLETPYRQIQANRKKEDQQERVAADDSSYSALHTIIGPRRTFGAKTGFLETAPKLSKPVTRRCGVKATSVE